MGHLANYFDYDAYARDLFMWDYYLHNQGYGSAMLKQVWHCAHLALDFDNGYVFRHY